MIVKNVTLEDMKQALHLTNIKYKYNVEFRDIRALNVKGTRFRFTLTVRSSKGLGTRLGQGGLMAENGAPWGEPVKRMRAACWHVHGDFFDNLFFVNPNAVVTSRNNTITAQYGNWEDFNIGSQMIPIYASEACVCNRSDYIKTESGQVILSR